MFRLANKSDCRWLWQVREHPSVAIQSLNPNPIPYLHHCRWFRQLLHNDQRRLDIFIERRSGTRIGYLRAEPFQSGHLLSWVIAPEFHGRGFGKQMLAHWCQIETTPLWAQIKTANISSKKIAAHAGFMKIASEDGLETWVRNMTYQ